MELNITYRGYVLDKFQIQAITEIENGHSLVLAAPTGSGKTLVAEYLIEKILQTDRRIIYTSPIKALSNQKYRDFSRLYGDKVGILTGDVVINREAQALIMTTEVYRNMAVEDPAAIADVAYVIFDEIHYLGDIERGTVWEESIIFSPKTVRFLALSATIPNYAELARWIESVLDHKVSVIAHNERAVPLSYLFYYKKNLQTFKELNKRARKSCELEEPQRRRRGEEKTEYRHFDIIRTLQSQDRLPVLYFVFSRAGANKMAKETARHFDFTSREEKERITAMVDAQIEKYSLWMLESANELREQLIRGVGVHHAGLLPQLKELVEVLFAERIVRALFVTETFAVGVNMPARTVAFDALKKFDGRSFRSMKALEFCQISGRAGRRGIDPMGWVVVPYLPRDLDIDETERLVYGDIEPLMSQFDLSFNSVLNLYAGHEDDEVRTILKRNFAQFQANRHLPKLAERVASFRSELDRVLPRCHEKTNDLEAYMAFHRKMRDMHNTMNQQMARISNGLRGRRNRPVEEQVRKEFDERFELLEAEEMQYICGRCQSRNRCSNAYLQASKIHKKLDHWRELLEKQEQLQLPIYEKKVSILRELGYIDEKGLQPRGEFAAKIHTEEIAVTELYFKGVFHEWEIHELNALALSLVYEHRKRGGIDSGKPHGKLFPRLRDAKSFIGALSRRYPFVKPLETGLADIMCAWSKGVAFTEISQMTDVPEGDLIRAFRQAIDVIRQVREATDDRSLREKFDACLDAINRDIVLATELRD
ncbi:MAG TPA: DEAD/DEAH box helicase [Candidatus Ozemobacteraceae bacterium]|nr:DEAD/DEAH box helicase [Candidatus Ozemobacteraceae bacterium]